VPKINLQKKQTKNSSSRGNEEKMIICCFFLVEGSYINDRVQTSTRNNRRRNRRVARMTALKGTVAAAGWRNAVVRGGMYCAPMGAQSPRVPACDLDKAGGALGVSLPHASLSSVSEDSCACVLTAQYLKSNEALAKALARDSVYTEEEYWALHGFAWDDSHMDDSTYSGIDSVYTQQRTPSSALALASAQGKVRLARAFCLPRPPTAACYL